MIVLSPAVFEVKLTLQVYVVPLSNVKAVVEVSSASVPSLTVTCPVRVPAPGDVTVTVPLTVYETPTSVAVSAGGV